MTQEQSEVVHEVMKRGASCGLPNDQAQRTRPAEMATDCSRRPPRGPGPLQRAVRLPITYHHGKSRAFLSQSSRDRPSQTMFATGFST